MPKLLVVISRCLPLRRRRLVYGADVRAHIDELVKQIQRLQSENLALKTNRK